MDGKALLLNVSLALAYSDHRRPICRKATVCEGQPHVGLGSPWIVDRLVFPNREPNQALVVSSSLRRKKHHIGSDSYRSIAWRCHLRTCYPSMNSRADRE